ncbi:hypothetical protein DY000_02030315 [Brassica cretica]|uniref:Aminotransferase-like plant mobile domain-containing protein n=1 Tax=Brassica cretica TaxID=69181 RepID=A0ABQ7DFY3_BRACR|nr:hypothetical protein DY000_02030315 [Brassica cretica]
MPAWKSKKLIASWRPGEVRNWSPMATAREGTPVARGDREGDACRSPVATVREVTARMACSVARGESGGGESTVARGDREGGESMVAQWRTLAPQLVRIVNPSLFGFNEWLGKWDQFGRIDIQKFEETCLPERKILRGLRLVPPSPKTLVRITRRLLLPRRNLSLIPEEAERYWAAACSKITPPLEAPFPHEAEFRIPVPRERVKDPPEGFFTCYEVFLRFRIWFTIPEIIVRVMNRFEISISQLNPTGMQHLIGILVLSYEYGLTLVPEHFEALLKTLQSSGPFSYRLAPQPFMSIIRGHTSNSHSWRKRWFFVRINSASVEESGIRYSVAIGNILPPFSEDLIAMRNLLRSGPFFWTSFAPERVRRALALFRSRADSVEVVEEETDSDIGDVVPQDVPIGDGQRKGKWIDLDDIEFSADGFPLPGWDPCFVPGDGSGTSKMPLPDCDF